MNNISKIIKTFSAFCILVLFHSDMCKAGDWYEGRESVVLQSGGATVVFDLGGGALADFHFNDLGINPFTWNHPKEGDSEAHSMGHFICFDRLGHPSEPEKVNGMTFHGEAANIFWEIVSPPEPGNGGTHAVLACELPVGRMKLVRTVTLSNDAPVLSVLEEVTNLNPLGKLYNLVQHPSLAPPFLDENVIIDCNAHKGFWAGNPFPELEKPVILWPRISYRGQLIDLRHMDDMLGPSVSNFVFPDEAVHGWVTVCNPSLGLLAGYVWELSEYPWIREWRHFREGKPIALGVEFGTTPLEMPFGKIVEKGDIFGRPVIEHLDTNASVTKSYTAFLAKIPQNFKGVGELFFSDGEITLKELNSAGRNDIVIRY